MKINNINSTSFKAYIPVRIYMRSNPNEEFFPANPNNAKKCNRYLVNKLNNPKEVNDINAKFVEYYSSYDKDYAEVPYVHSKYDKYLPYVTLISGKNARDVDNFGKKIGIAKGSSKKMFGHTKSQEVRVATQNYYNDIRENLQESFPPVTDKDNNPLNLYAFFDNVKYDKDGKIKQYDFVGAELSKEIKTDSIKTPNISMIPQQLEYKQKSIFDLL